MAWVEKRGDGFRVRYRLPDGTLHTENGFTTQNDAENRAADIESDQRRNQFVDPRLAQTTIDEWIRAWSDAHHVSNITWATYDSHIRNHILPHWSGTAIGDIQRIMVKGWANRTLRTKLADKSVKDIIVLFSMILSEAVDEGLIGSNPCRKLRLGLADRPERPHATPDEIDAIAARVAPDDGLMIITAAYTGMRWGELAGLQWSRTYLDDNPRIEIDPDVGALHEVRGRLELGPPKTPASARPVYLPPFLTQLLTEHHDRNPHTRFVFTGPEEGMHRRSNFRRRVWLPALTGNTELGWGPIQPTMHFHDLRHTHKTWLIEDSVPRVVQLQRLGHKPQDTSDLYSHVTPQMIETLRAALQARWDTYGTWTWADHLGNAKVIRTRAPKLLPQHTNGPSTKIIDRPLELRKRTVGDTGIEPVTSSV
ncbi:site-specific integrase [Amycolatopsis taiwanensis]|uniref:tyrosine-type recombinase/integrase n=1 Tax=Amycolatopsis taiwanensis TaxID=342230 RepID=UPI000A03B3BD